jgi:hypothetical protein
VAFGFDWINLFPFVPLPFSTFRLFSRLSSTFFDCLWSFFYVPRPSGTFRFAQLVFFRLSSFVNILSLFSTLFKDEERIGNGDRVDDEQPIGKNQRIDDEEEIGTVSKWVTESGSGTSPNR